MHFSNMPYCYCYCLSMYCWQNKLITGIYYFLKAGNKTPCLNKSDFTSSPPTFMVEIVRRDTASAGRHYVTLMATVTEIYDVIPGQSQGIMVYLYLFQGRKQRCTLPRCIDYIYYAFILRDIAFIRLLLLFCLAHVQSLFMWSSGTDILSNYVFTSKFCIEVRASSTDVRVIDVESLKIYYISKCSPIDQDGGVIQY